MNRPEEQIQRAIVQYLALVYPRGNHWLCWMAVTNQRGSRTPYEQIVLCEMGLQNGAPDLLLFPADHPPIFLEVKAPKGRQSSTQREMERWAESVGCRYALARSVEDVVSLLDALRPTKRARLA